MADTAVLDVDGTLVDTNFQHALAWYRAFRRYDIVVPVWRVHRAIGMGGDQLVAAVAGDGVERARGDDLRAAWEEEYAPMLAEVVPFAGARELLDQLRRRGFTVVLASSGQAEQTERYLDLLGVRDQIDGWTTADDVDHTKPDPDLVHVAMRKVNGSIGVLVGDSSWDCQAAQRAGATSYALRSGGFSPEELREAGAAGVYDGLEQLCADLDRTELARATAPDDR